MFNVKIIKPIKLTIFNSNIGVYTGVNSLVTFNKPIGVFCSLKMQIGDRVELS